MQSVIDLVRRIEGGTLTSAAAIDLCAGAIAARESEVGAFVCYDLASARKAAAQASHKPLRGIAIGVKDIFDTAEFPSEYGTPIHAGNRPRTDAALVALARRAGGVVLGKTVTTELASFQPGKTRNPVNPAHTPGGSSSGSAAAVAAGMLPLAFGTQTAGSIIRPASYCGVVGFKPSYRILPTVGIKCFSWSLDTAGLFAATVADVAFAAAVITRRDLRVDQSDPGVPSIALVRSHQWSEASDAMQAAMDIAARAATAAGARVHTLDLPQIFRDATEAHPRVQDYEAYQALAYEYDHHRAKLSPPLRDLLDKAALISSDSYDAARRTAKRTRQVFADTIDADVILTPSATGAAPYGIESTGKPTFNRMWTLLGNPCVNVPGLVDPDGLPLGMQIVGRFGRDHAALKAAAFLENALRRHATG